jgi:hypothetical protein
VVVQALAAPAALVLEVLVAAALEEAALEGVAAADRVRGVDPAQVDQVADAAGDRGRAAVGRAAAIRGVPDDQAAATREAAEGIKGEVADRDREAATRGAVARVETTREAEAVETVREAVADKGVVRGAAGTAAAACPAAANLPDMGAEIPSPPPAPRPPMPTRARVWSGMRAA